jgi:arylsulfatase A
MFGKTMLVLLISTILLRMGTNADAVERPPNVVLIMADDVSWECFSCYGAEDYQTPCIDDLASRGIRFSHCYSTPICTTSRVKIMTGKYNFRNYTHFAYLDPTEKTFANLLKQAGYSTAVAGKWQLNGLPNSMPGHADNGRPQKAGFDEYMLWQLTTGRGTAAGGGERFWSPPIEHNGQFLTIEMNHGRYGPDMFCDFICDFMTRNREKPFFVYYPMVLVHDPFVPTPDSIGDRERSHAANKPPQKDPRQRKQNFIAMVQYMDKIVGRIQSKIEELGLAEDTMLLFTADNGTNRSITSKWKGQDIRGGKGGMTDMGTHVPLVAYWQGHTPKGAVLDDLIDFTDFYPTLADAAGLAMGQDDPIDGRSFLPQLKGQAGNPRDWVLCHYQPYWNKTPGQFVRSAEFKLYRSGQFFNPPNDLKEQNHFPDGFHNRVRNRLHELLERCPPAPSPTQADRNTKDRPVYPDWPNLFESGPSK